MADGELLPIGRYARATGLTIKALRLYADAGVLAPARVDELSGYRYYRADQVVVGQLTRILRELGVPVVELASVRVALADGADPKALLGDRIRADEARLTQRRRLLDTLHHRLEATGMTREITTRTWHADPALRIRADVVHTDYAQFVAEAYQRLYTAAGRGPLTLSGPAYQRYHGRVDDDGTTVTMEACLPFCGDRVQPDGLPDGVDVLPARTMTFASTTMRGAETAYPGILEGSDAVADWMARHGFDFAGPAYEIVRRWHGQIGHPDNVIEVGFPISG